MSTFSDRLLQDGKLLALAQAKYDGRFLESLESAVDRAISSVPLPKLHIPAWALRVAENRCEMEYAEERGSDRGYPCGRSVVMVCRHCGAQLCDECIYSYCMEAKNGLHEKEL
jgi:hypothetical protein